MGCRQRHPQEAHIVTVGRRVGSPTSSLPGQTKARLEVLSAEDRSLPYWSVSGTDPPPRETSSRIAATGLQKILWMEAWRETGRGKDVEIRDLFADERGRQAAPDFFLTIAAGRQAPTPEPG